MLRTFDRIAACLEAEVLYKGEEGHLFWEKERIKILLISQSPSLEAGRPIILAFATVIEEVASLVLFTRIQLLVSLEGILVCGNGLISGVQVMGLKTRKREREREREKGRKVRDVDRALLGWQIRSSKLI